MMNLLVDLFQLDFREFRITSSRRHFSVNTLGSFIEFFIRTIPVFLHIENRLCHLLQIGNLDFLSVGIVLLGFYAILQIYNQPEIRLDV